MSDFRAKHPNQPKDKLMTRLLRSWRQLAAICSVVLLTACASQGHQQAAAGTPATVAPTHPTLFQVNFDSNKYDITPDGKQTIDEVARLVSEEHAKTFIALIGHTDTAGSAAINTRLAEHRAMAVHDALMATGKIPAGRIVAAWTGEEEQIIQTGNAKPDARNRVVDIFIIDDVP